MSTHLVQTASFTAKRFVFFSSLFLSFTFGQPLAHSQCSLTPPAAPTGLTLTAGSTAAPAVTTSVNGSGLVAYWKFDEGMGTSACDSSGNGNNGTLVNGPQWKIGVAGKALYFDGIDDNVTVLNSNSLNPSGSFTISAWVNPAKTFTDFRSILVKNYKYYLYSSVAGYCGDGSPLGGFNETANVTACQASPLPANIWTHLSLTSDGSRLTLYRNGATVATAIAAEALSPSTGTLQIGASQFGEYFQGLIDEVQIYNRALSASEIQTIYQQVAVNLPFDYAVSNSGNQSVNAGSSANETINASLLSGISQGVAFTVSGLPSGASASFSSTSCTLSCSTLLSITTSGATPAGSYPITVTSAGGGVNRSTVFTLSVTLALTVATPTITPNGGAFSGALSIAMQTTTPGASIFYTMDGSSPTQSSTLYTGALTFSGSTTVNAKAFKTGYNPSNIASAVFTNAGGKTYYVAKTGSDNNSCSQAQNSSSPKLTITAALACIGTSTGSGAGYTVEVAAGVYNERFIGNIPGGSSWAAPFTLRAKAGDAVTIKPTFSLDLPILEPYSSYAVIQGFILDGRGQTGVMVRLYGSYQRLLNNELKNVDGDNGIYIANGAHDNEIIGGSIHDGIFIGCATCGGGGTSYPIYLEGNNNLIEGVNIYNFPRFGIHINNGYSSHPDNNTIRTNVLHNGATAWPSGSAIIVYTGMGNMIYNNIIYAMTGHGLIIGSTNNAAYNNTVYGGQQSGIYVYPGAQNAIVKNNIVYANSTAQILDQGTGTALSNNLTAGNPLFIAPSSANFHLQSGSPAIDAGTNLSTIVPTDFDGVARPQGRTFDIGAFEYVF